MLEAIEVSRLLQGMCERAEKPFVHVADQSFVRCVQIWKRCKAVLEKEAPCFFTFGAVLNGSTERNDLVVGPVSNKDVNVSNHFAP